MDMELDEIFQWQTPFCSLLADIAGIEEDGIERMLDQIGFPELQEDIVPVAAAAAAATEEPVSSPLWPCDLVKLPPVQLPEITKHSQDPVGSPQSSSAPVVQKEAVQEVAPVAQKEAVQEVAPVAQKEAVQEVAPSTPAVAKSKRTRASKSTPKAKKPCTEQPLKEKENRLPTQAEHIIRERQRRDDMSAKYSILESLLPPAPKRERAVVVESAMLFVKDLQQKRSELLKRRAHLKLLAPSQQVQSKKMAPVQNSSGLGTTSGGSKKLENCRTDSPISSSQEDLIASPGSTNPSVVIEDPTSSNPSVQHLHVHVHFSEEEIIIEMVCHQPRHNFQSFLLKAVESFGLDVVRCSVQRVLHGLVQCTITCTRSTVQNTSFSSSEIRTSSLIEALKKVLTQS